MSRSPRTKPSTDSLAEYRSAWLATMKLIREGHSFSGRERNCVFLNCRDQRFANVSSVSGLDFDDDGRAMGITDWDQDGDLDVWLFNRTGPRLRFMRNQTISDQIPPDSQFVIIGLQGTVSNRDAIGARVELVLQRSPSGERTSRPRIQTLSAGDAFLSQSSKWLHFGLESKSGISHATVRWPNGQSERFSGIQAGRRYRLIEGSGQSILLEPRGKLTLPNEDRSKIVASPAQRVFLSNRLPLPILNFTSFDGEKKSLQQESRPLLITLWASWCDSCKRELTELTQGARDFRAANLEILALSIDGLDLANSSRPEDASDLLKTIAFPFKSGVATREFLDKFEIAQSVLFATRPALTVPTSLLVDSSGEISAVYRGPVIVKQLLEDVENLNRSREDRRRHCVPFAGTWVNPPRQLLMRGVARLFKRQGYDDDAARYLRLDVELMKRQRSLARTDDERQNLDNQFAEANYQLGQAMIVEGELTEAMACFQQALAADPNHINSLINLGALFAKTKKLPAAITILARAVQVDPKSTPARMNLASALAASGQFEKTLVHYQAVLDLQPHSQQAHARLGRALIETRKLSLAIPHLEKAVSLNANDFAASWSLAWLKATAEDESLRDGRVAVEIAKRLSASRAQDPLVLDLLAVAMAEEGDFKAAQRFATDALQRLGNKQPTMTRIIKKRLDSYQAGIAHRDADGKYP